MIDIDKVYTSNNYGDFRIVNYNHCNDIEVEFLDTGYRVVTVSSSITKGMVKDKMLPIVFGVGFIGGDKYPSNTRAYECWSGMIQRCYDKNRTKRNASYAGVVVCDIWHNYQNFADWYVINYPGDGNKYHLDKDINQRGVKDKIYSPSTCAFLTVEANNIESKAKHYKFKNPLGDIVMIYNLAKFAIENKLTRRSMGKVHDGNRNHHKGWTKA